MDGQHKNRLCKKLVKKEEWKETAREVTKKIKLLNNQIQGLTASFRLIHSLADQHWGFFSIRKLVSNTKEKQQIETSTQKEAPENKEEENQEKDRHKIEAKERKWKAEIEMVGK